MSFGRPPSINVGFKTTPPDRGSFPLDHYGECKEKMKLYLECLKQNGSDSSPCRVFNKGYLGCRMEKGLMDRDEWKNLGLANVEKTLQSPKHDDMPATESNGHPVSHPTHK